MDERVCIAKEGTSKTIFGTTVGGTCVFGCGAAEPAAAALTHAVALAGAVEHVFGVPGRAVLVNGLAPFVLNARVLHVRH